jgi:hypothetical protein
MSLLAAIVLAAASARVESVYLTTADQRLAVRVALSGTPGMVAVHREGTAARVSIMDASLGLQFAGGRRFSWTPSDGFDPALLAASPAKLDRIEIAATDSEVSVLLHVPPDVAVDVRRTRVACSGVPDHGPGSDGAGGPGAAACRVSSASRACGPTTPEPKRARSRGATSSRGAGRACAATCDRSCRADRRCASCRAAACGTGRRRSREAPFPGRCDRRGEAGGAACRELYPSCSRPARRRQPEAPAIVETPEPGRKRACPALSACASRWTHAT